MECAIQTFKNHFISGLCSTNSEWPIQLWDQFAVQAVITHNILRTSHIDPTKSAYHQLNGHKYDWNAYPMAPLEHEPWSMKTQTRVHHGEHEARTHGIVAHRWTTIDAAFFMCPKQDPIAFQDRSTCSRSIVYCPNFHQSSMHTKCTTNCMTPSKAYCAQQKQNS